MQKVPLSAEICTGTATANTGELDDVLSSTDFGHIAFKRVVEDARGNYAAYLRPPNQNLNQTPPAESMDDHVIASRTFATFPPVDNMHINFSTIFNPSFSVRNTSGVTTYDLQSCIANQ